MRYKGLSYEPSHLALVLTPLFSYFLIKYALHKKRKDFTLIVATGLPIAATMSFGFAAAFFLSVLLMAIPLIFLGGRLRTIMLWVLLLSITSAVFIGNTDNTISKRMKVVMEGNDSSVNGRTTEAFYLGYECAKKKSKLFGIGQGQIKVIGEEVIRPYYIELNGGSKEKWPAVIEPYFEKKHGYSKENWPQMALPNSSAETLAIFGILGLVLRILFEIFLFFRMKVYKNWFQLFLFIFIFTYQLMGSFMLSVAEILMWVLAFTPLFPSLEILKRKQHKAA
jgi:hypothetical protein